MDMLQKLKKGDVVAVKRLTDGRFDQYTVATVGRKYFTVDALPKLNFSLETMLSDKDNSLYGFAYKAYFSMQEYNDEVEVGVLTSKLLTLLRGKHEIPLASLREMVKLAGV